MKPPFSPLVNLGKQLLSLEQPAMWRGDTGKHGNRRGYYLLAVALVCGLSLVTWQYWSKVQIPDEAGRQTRSAFLRWRGMIHELMGGGNIYIGRQEYPNPPIMALILWPFAAVPPLTGALAWLYVKVGLAGLAIIWLARIAAPPPLSLPGILLGVAVAIPAVIGDLTHNNVNIFIFFLVTACLECVRRGWDQIAGLALALSIACKVTPLLFVPYFLWKRAWRLLGATAVGLFLWLLAVPSLVFGWERNLQLLTDWYHLMVERPVFQGEVVSEHPNQSLVGWTYRLFTHSPSFIRYVATTDGDLPVPAAYHNLMEWRLETAWMVTKGWGIAFVALMMILCRTPREERQGWRRLAEYGWIVMGMLLLSERTWKHHAVTLAVPGLAVAATMAAGVGTRSLRRGLLLGQVTALLLIVVPGLCGRRIQDLALVYGTHTLAFLLQAVAMAVVLTLTSSRTVGTGNSTEMANTAVRLMRVASAR